MKKFRVVIDYETRSECDLKKCGASVYARHLSTEILCMGYKINSEKTELWLPEDPFPLHLAKAINYAAPANLIAHNAMFEQLITEFVLRKRYTSLVRPLPPERWKCTAAKAAACALPRDLEGAALALKLPITKNMRGRKLMLKHSKPRPAWAKWRAQYKAPSTGGVDFAYLKDQPDKYFEDEFERAEIYAYCVTDVDVEDLVDRTLPDLGEYETAVWVLNQHMNLRGVRIDIETVKKVIGWLRLETSRLQKELGKITNGEVETVNQRDRFLAWVRSHNLTIPNLQSATVDTMVSDMKLPAPVKRALEIRQSVGKSSIKKYPAMLSRSDFDGYARDTSMYWGASTGRTTGKGIQLHNLVKGKIKNTDFACDVLANEDLDFVKLIFGDPFEVFSSCVRGMVRASGMHHLYVADYNAIEARVLNWIAGQESVLQLFRDKKDPYVVQAANMWSIKPERVDKDQRDVGKRAELGLGYQMGDKKFLETCHKYGAKSVDAALAKRAVVVYRSTHEKVVSLWSNLEQAAIRAVKKQGTAIKVNRTSWLFDGRFLWCELPSGRKLAYYGPTVCNEPTPWGEFRPKLYHWGVDPLTKKWVNAATYGGKLTENVTQATARDVMVHASMNLKKYGFNFLFEIYDEIVSESFEPKGVKVNREMTLAAYEVILMDLPAWAEGLPIVAKGWHGFRYKKG